MAGSEFPVTGDQLKKLVKKSRAMPIAFGFNPGTSDDDDEYLAAHARKQPEMLGKMALSEGAGTKSAFGTFVVDGSELHLTCFRTIPQLAKKFKKYLKRAKITLNVVVMDPDGNVLDSDVEVLDDWFREAEEAGEAADEAAEAVEEAAEAAGVEIPAAPPPPAADAATLAARLKALQPRLAGLPPGVAEKVAAAFRGAVDLLRGGQAGPAAAAIAQIEAVLDRLAAAPPPEPPPAPQPESAPPQGTDPRLARLHEAVDRLAVQAAALAGDVAGTILDDLERIGAQIDAGEAEAAMTALKAAQEAIRAAEAAAERWQKAAAVLEGQIEQALALRSVADPDGLRVRWQFAVALAAEGAFDRALASVPGIVAMLRAGSETVTEGEDGGGVVAFQSSRVLWAGTRDRMLEEARKLADAIVANSTEDEDSAEIAIAAREILAEVEGVDLRLQAVLDEITNAEPRARAPLKKRAAGIVAEYRALLGSGVFPELDNNPFTPVAVTARARAALDRIAATLA